MLLFLTVNTINIPYLTLCAFFIFAINTLMNVIYFPNVLMLFISYQFMEFDKIYTYNMISVVS